MNEFLDQLRKQVPGLMVKTDTTDIAHACTDWRKRYQTTALALLEPLNAAQIQGIVKVCDQFDVAISTQGGNTGLVGGAVPTAEGDASKRPHVVLKTGRIREVLKLDESNLTLTASAGYTLYEIQEYASAHGFLFPLSLASEGTCTLGGNLASNAGGVAVLRYGNTRELCLGLEYVNAQGELCGDLRGLRKNNTGYDLRHLLIGSDPLARRNYPVWNHHRCTHSCTGLRLVQRLQHGCLGVVRRIGNSEWHFNYRRLPPPLGAPHLRGALVSSLCADVLWHHGRSKQRSGLGLGPPHAPPPCGRHGK